MVQQSRKFLMTLNNPESKGFDVNKCMQLASTLKGLIYACASMEIGAKEHTPHIHMFVYYKNPKSWETMRHLIEGADWRCCRGTCKDNRTYVFKLGKWLESEKGTTRVEGSQIEYGDLPDERSCPKPELELLLELIQQGYSDYRILQEYPEYMFDISHIQRCRLTLKQEEFKDVWRNLEVTYVFGATGAGKSRYVMDKHGYGNVFRITDYIHPYDTYNSEECIVWEEYNSSFKLQDALNYLDGYPLKLPARYSDKIACYTRVYIISNIPLEAQYPNAQSDSNEVWKAFLRRITNVIWFQSSSNVITYNSVTEYFKSKTTFRKVNDNEATQLSFLE